MKTAGSADPATDEPTRARSRGWLVGPWFDATCIAWAWVPFYLFVVVVLGLDGSWSLGGRDGNGTEPGLGLAMLIALGVSYVHRHYTFLLVYGDDQTFGERVRSYTLVPAALFIGLALVLRVQGELSWVLFGLKMRPWMLVLFVTGAWNMWHTLMQRYGITRIYASKAGGGLQTPAHGRRDLRLMWAAVLLTAALTSMFRASTFAGIANGRRVLIALEPIIHGALGWTLLAIITGATLVMAGSWAIHERAASLSLRERIPRLNFVASTAALLLVFVVHGPIIGYLCFGVAHAIEYVCFFHVFGRRKFAGREPQQRQGLAAKLLARPLVSGPIIALALAGLFIALADHRKSEPYLVYYTATSLLHFLYDGWIWKVRKPEVARHL
ncbi:hypothetical protein DB30_02051 [Enhygromyxa salina]|uniref:Uncharacterized protein n=1 Tax=Enhygromyxa salina TaxID=215803 RepID=A0A0C2CW29_9BACT|nr:hypothetical protein [Enhygromyxa salina]KIG12077.1 hypothetical protein DB30_02051 [Enhygromyxa salina]